MNLMATAFKSLEKVSCGISPLFQLCVDCTTSVIAKEISLGNINGEDVVLNIGCGAIPFTAINLTRFTGAKIIAVDRDPNVIIKARSRLYEKGMGCDIELLQGDAADFKPPEFSVALIALQAEPKVKILKNLMNNAKKGVRLIFRQPKEMFKIQYDYLPQTYVPVERKFQGTSTIEESIMYVKS